MIIACDIGGVVTNMATDEPVDGAIAGLAQLSTLHDVIFISKCGDSFKAKSTAWLAAHELGSVPTYYCEEHGDKAAIAAHHAVNVMIDDRIKVLRTFPDEVVKIWFCDEPKKVAGTRKHQPEIFATLRLATTWSQVLDIVNAASDDM
jgi:hypothetical protein